MRTHRVAAAVVAAALVSPRAAACPVCDSDTGRQVREGLVDGDFARNALAVVLPFAAAGAVVAAVHFGRPNGWPLNRRRDGNGRQ